MRPADRPAAPDLRLERSLARRGVESIAGIDEVGRGALAGPIFAAAVILPIHRRGLAATLREVDDSKLMTGRQRRRSAERIRRVALDWSLGQASCEEIDRMGPLEATRLAMGRAVQALHLAAQHLLIDHVRLGDIDLPQTSIPHGDAQVLSIAAASILAKVARDDLMVTLARDFPTYGFSRHKGYGTAAHLEALRRWGPCPIHRRSFEPVSVLVQAQAA